MADILDTIDKSLRSSTKTKHAFTRAEVPHIISQLEQERDHAKARKQYKHAQLLENQLLELKHLHQDLRLNLMEQQQTNEVAANDASFQEAYETLQHAWNERMQAVHTQTQVAEQHMLARQAEEAASMQDVHAAFQPRPKYSAALLNMRHIERSLAAQKEFSKAAKVKQQADQLETLELSHIGVEQTGKMEAERARLAAQHIKEREAAAKKATSALLGAKQRQEYEVEQLIKRHQALKLALQRSHAAQRLNLKQNIKGALGLAKPSAMLGLPSFNTSLAEARGLVPEPVQQGFDPPAPGSKAHLASTVSPTRLNSSSCDRNGNRVLAVPLRAVSLARAPSPSRGAGCSRTQSPIPSHRHLTNSDEHRVHSNRGFEAHASSATVITDSAGQQSREQAGLSASTLVAMQSRGHDTVSPLPISNSLQQQPQQQQQLEQQRLPPGAAAGTHGSDWTLVQQAKIAQLCSTPGQVGNNKTSVTGAADEAKAGLNSVAEQDSSAVVNKAANALPLTAQAPKASAAMDAIASLLGSSTTTAGRTSIAGQGMPTKDSQCVDSYSSHSTEKVTVTHSLSTAAAAAGSNGNSAGSQHNLPSLAGHVPASALGQQDDNQSTQQHR